MMKTPSKGIKKSFIFFLIFSIHIILFVLIKDHGKMMDEHLHYRQIQSFLHGDFTIDWELPMTAGYHLVLATIGKILKFDQIPFYPAVTYFRSISFLFSLATIVVFYLCAASINKSQAIVKTLQFSFFPLIFPFFSLLYTDLFSLLLVLLAFLFVLKKRYILAATLSAVSILVRQNNLIWAIFFNLLIYFQNYGWKISWKNIWGHTKTTISFVLPPLVFLAYVLLNGRLAMGTGTLVFTTISWTNLFIIQIYFVVLFAPLILANLKKILRFILKHRKYYLLSLLTFPLYALIFTNTHPVNDHFGRFFIHNIIADFFTDYLATQFFSFLITLLTITTLIFVSLENKIYYTLYPFIFIFLIPLWMIEGRYYIIPYILFLLFRKNLSVDMEYFLVFWFIAISLYLYYGIFFWKFFP